MDQALPVARSDYRRVLRDGVARWRKWITLHNVRESMGLQNVRMAIVGSAAIATELVRWYGDIGVAMFEGYGLAEAGGFVSVTSPSETLGGAGVQMLPKMTARLADDGEILVAGPTVHRGYWGTGASAGRSSDGSWLRTGDYGVPASQAGFRFGGRMADRFVTDHEQTVAPHSFESAIKLSPYVLDALLIGGGRAFCTALVALDENSVGKFARDNEIPYTDHVSLARRPEVVALVSRRMAVVNESLAGPSKVLAFRILSEPLNAYSEELTPALRLRRHYVELKYATLIEEMYLG
jgi:long-chain acyl-CoA synthetase